VGGQEKRVIEKSTTIGLEQEKEGGAKQDSVKNDGAEGSMTVNKRKFLHNSRKKPQIQKLDTRTWVETERRGGE